MYGNDNLLCLKIKLHEFKNNIKRRCRFEYCGFCEAVWVTDCLCVCIGFPDCHETGDYPCPQGLGPGCCGTGQWDYQDDEGGHSHPAQRRSVANEHTAVYCLRNLWLMCTYQSQSWIRCLLLKQTDIFNGLKRHMQNNLIKLVQTFKQAWFLCQRLLNNGNNND